MAEIVDFWEGEEIDSELHFISYLTQARQTEQNCWIFSFKLSSFKTALADMKNKDFLSRGLVLFVFAYSTLLYINVAAL